MVTQSHIRLEKEQNYHNQVCLSCIAGIYGCRWKRYRRSKDPSSIVEKIFAAITTLSFMCATVWLYYWVIADNDSYDFNRYIAVHTHTYFNWFSLFYALTIVSVIYTGILVIFAVSHLLIGLQLHLHWSHKCLVVTIILGSVVSSTLLSRYWPQGFYLMALSFQITGPLLQLLSVGMVTALGWLVCSCYFRISTPVVRYSLLVGFSILAAFIYLSPLMMNTPCLTDSTLDKRPKVMAHRGAPQLAPENTQVSFEKAIEYDVYGLESDVTISMDGELFLNHDYTFEFTTNIAAVFPDRIREPASNFTWADIQQLNAGSWFLERDPCGNVRHLSKDEKDTYRNQTIMTLKDLLDLAIKENKKVVFDLSRPVWENPYYDNYMNYTITQILKQNIKYHQIWWLVGNDQSAEYIQQKAPTFLTTAEGYWDVQELVKFHVTNVNAEYSEIFEDDISQYMNKNITSNIYVVGKRWLYSLFWCEGARTVTSSACHIVQTVTSPYAFLSPNAYLAVWIIADLASVFVIIVIYLLHRKHHNEYVNNPEAISLNSARHRYGPQGRRKSDKELLFGGNKKNSPRESDSESPVRTPQEILNAADASQKDSLPDHEVVGIQME